MRYRNIIRLALEEDIGSGDITTDFLDLAKKDIPAFMIAKENGILCGLEISFEVFKMIDKNIKCIGYKKDGDSLKPGDIFAKIEGYSNHILMGERVALNFIQRMSGIATMTHQFVEKIKPYSAKLLDTRKTTPLLRDLDKYSVRIGGGFNHRFGLYDMILIKENHIRAAGSIAKAVKAVKSHNTSYKIEVEVTNHTELAEAVLSGVDRVMLDNMSLKNIREAVQNFGTSVELEVSGNVNIHTINEYAATGVDFISCGALTHSFKSLDISLLFSEGL